MSYKNVLKNSQNSVRRKQEISNTGERGEKPVHQR